MFTPRTPRVVAARKLLTRRARDERRQFLVEGPQAVREAVAAGAVLEVFATPAATQRHHAMIEAAAADGARCCMATPAAVAALSETVNPQGVVAVCGHRDVPLQVALARGPRLVTVLVDVRDPGNAGTVLRTSDAAGAQAVIFAGDTVDPHNGKCVRASAGSLFHLDVVLADDPVPVVSALRAAGLQVLATCLRDAEDLDGAGLRDALAAPTAWVFGSEAHGLPQAVAQLADRRVRVPIHGRAESLNLAAAAAVCLYASARVHPG